MKLMAPGSGNRGIVDRLVKEGRSGEFRHSSASRRQFLAGLAALGASAAAFGTQACAGGGETTAPEGATGEGRAAQIPITGAGRIDVHHHYGSPLWVKTLADADALNVSAWETWDPSQAVEAMDAGGVQTSISSITVPGIYFAEGFGNQQAPPGATLDNDVVTLARDVNEFGAKMKADYPGRWGIWASLPLPNVDASLLEIEYALDTLGLEGIGLACSIGATYLGDPAFSPVFEELNRRGAVVYTHPQAGPCCLNMMTTESGRYLGPTTLEYSQDTARTIVSWIESGSAERFPNVQWIFSHGGGAIWSQRFINGEIGTSPQAFAELETYPRRLAFLRKYFYDTTASNNFVYMERLKTLAGISQIVLGTDNPYGQPLTYVESLRELAEAGVLTVEEVEMIGRGNMLRLMPQLATT